MPLILRIIFEAMTSPSAQDFLAHLKTKFPHEPTLKQSEALAALAAFVCNSNSEELLLLKGYAGTGKTTLMGTLVNQLWQVKYKAVLMAPTGRAAKVMSQYANTTAYTIHRKIYFPKKVSGGGVQFTKAPNKHRHTIFIVDEASMIPDTNESSGLKGAGALLDDLISYVYSGHKCKLILVGDVAQLPPVHLNISPALDQDRLILNYAKTVPLVSLDEVVRQAADSGILFNATLLRDQLESEFFEHFQFSLEGFSDIVRLVEGHDIQEAIEDAYSQGGKEETAFIVRSNKRANLYNESIRSRILFLENELSTGDYMMVVKNNYFWLDPISEAGFIANGDIIEILEIFAIKELYGFRFAEVKVRMVDYPNQKPFETVLLLDTIAAESPSLSYEDGNKLYQAVSEDYASEKSNYKKFLSIKNNKFFNALQVKFSYAITCHKSQGGQWDTVFVEQPYLPNDIDKEYLRWLYTAITRAKKKLYLIGFKERFFEEI